MKTPAYLESLGKAPYQKKPWISAELPYSKDLLDYWSKTTHVTWQQTHLVGQV